jgi:hypothetical protein
MKIWFIILILIACQASATVEDIGSTSSSTTGSSMTGSVWPGSSGPPATTIPVSFESCPEISGSLVVTIALTGPTSETDSHYTTPGKVMEYMVSVHNDGPSEVEAEISVNPKTCQLEWFSWTTKSLKIPSGVSRSESLLVKPDLGALAGDYSFIVEASAPCRSPGSSEASFKVQAFDYASETSISGTGQFQINKDVRSMDSGIKSNKDITFSGSVDALIKNEYLVDRAKGRVPNFEEQDAVDNYNALVPGDALFGTEAFKSSAVFGGVGAKVLESYNVQQMEFKNQDFNLHQTGSLKKMAEFRTADNFTGFYLLDAKQVVPGLKSLKEHEEYLGSFDINRRILFKGSPAFVSPCFSGSCDNFVKSLNEFARSA